MSNSLFAPYLALQIVQQYTVLFHQVSKMKKLFVKKEIYNHISGKSVEVTITIPIGYNLNSGGFTEWYTTSTIGYNDKENLTDWIKLQKAGYKEYLVHCGSIKDFLELPDWDEEMIPTITSKVLTEEAINQL